MPRQYNIRWRRVDEELLQRTVRNYNAKRRRLINIDPKNAELLPDKVTVKQLRENIGSRRDFNNAIRRLQRFSRRGSEQLVTVQGTTLTKYEYREIQLSLRRLNRLRSEEKKRLENMILKSRGESLGYTVGMGDVSLKNLEKKTLNLRNKSRREIEKYFDMIDLQSTDKYYDEKAERYRENYIKGFQREFSGMPFYDEFLRQLENLDADTFVKVLYNDTEGGIDFIYDESERMERYEAIANVWSGEIDTSKILDYYNI